MKVDTADYVHLVTEKCVVWMKIRLDTDVKMVAAPIFQIDWNGMYAEMFLTE